MCNIVGLRAQQSTFYVFCPVMSMIIKNDLDFMYINSYNANSISISYKYHTYESLIWCQPYGGKDYMLLFIYGKSRLSWNLNKCWEIKGIGLNVKLSVVKGHRLRHFTLVFHSCEIYLQYNIPQGLPLLPNTFPNLVISAAVKLCSFW